MNEPKPNLDSGYGEGVTTIQSPEFATLFSLVLELDKYPGPNLGGGWKTTPPENRKYLDFHFTCECGRRQKLSFGPDPAPEPKP